MGIAVMPIPVTAQSASAKPPAGTASPKPAPVDELFGRFEQSVLEIENRLGAVALKTDLQLRTPDSIGAIDYIEDGAIAWCKRYPTDPWLPKALSRLVTFYARAGAADSPRAVATLATLGTLFPKSPEEGRALLAIYDTPATPAQTIVTGQVVADATGAPVAGAIVMVAPNHESDDIGSTPFGTTANDGSFSVSGVPLAAPEYIVVEPPRGSAYVAYHGKFDPVADKGAAGVIRLAAR
jgi:hypothetical protein